MENKVLRQCHVFLVQLLRTDVDGTVHYGKCGVGIFRYVCVHQVKYLCAPMGHTTHIV